MIPTPDMNMHVTSRPRRATSAATPSVEASPPSSRRLSQVMGPPSALYNQSMQPGSPTLVTADTSSAATGPLRHPKPLTQSDLHSMLEKEQEAIVNRLTRELSLLRQQTASVASTASSTSTTFNEPDAPYLASATHPAPSTRHRSSSSLSSYIPAVQGSRNRSVSGILPPRDIGIPASRPPADLNRGNRSRGTSVTSRQSESLSSSLHQPGEHFPNRNSSSHLPTNPMSRYEEAAHHRGELESVRRENEELRQRVRDLELTLKKYREGSTDTGDE